MARVINAVILGLLQLLVQVNSASLPEVDSRDWWEHANFYQIYPRSFQDSNGDGIGDLNGITSRLEYLSNDLQVDAVWLSPIMKSPMADFGYDIADYYSIQEEYGSMTDFENLLAKAKELGLKIFLDFVPNHTSDEHDWFIKSAKKEEGYEDFYVWHPGTTLANGTHIPPNNWISIFRYSAWEWNEVRQEFYYHQFAVKQPDLNYRSSLVVEAMKNVLRFWLNKGVYGFRIDAVPYLFEVEMTDGQYPNEALSGTCTDPNDYCYLIHNYTQDQPETYQMIYSWRALLDDFTTVNSTDKVTRVILTEAYTSLENTIRFYGDGETEGSHIPFNFQLISYTNILSNAAVFMTQIDSWLDVMPSGKVANWVMGNHDNKRLASRFGPKRVDLLNILLQTLPGVAVTYNGEEIGMTDVWLSWEDSVDPQACNTNSQVYNSVSRDPARTPFQWDATAQAGFSTSNSTWLPVSSNYKTLNVAAQKVATKSHLKVFQKLVEIRKLPTLQLGSYEEALVNDYVLAYKRAKTDEKTYIVLLNFGFKPYRVDLSAFFSDVPDTLTVTVASITTTLTTGSTVARTKVVVPGEVGIVFEY